MMRWIGSVLIGLLLLLDLVLPQTGIGRRGAEASVRAEAGAGVPLGTALRGLELRELDGRPFDLASLRGHRVLLTFERSVDW
jgi:hypothetical protein